MLKALFAGVGLLAACVLPVAASEISIPLQGHTSIDSYGQIRTWFQEDPGNPLPWPPGSASGTAGSDTLVNSLNCSLAASAGQAGVAYAQGEIDWAWDLGGQPWESVKDLPVLFQVVLLYRISADWAPGTGSGNAWVSFDSREGQLDLLGYETQETGTREVAWGRGYDTTAEELAQGGPWIFTAGCQAHRPPESPGVNSSSASIVGVRIEVTILATVPTLISPNGGEAWNYGENQPITWTAPDTVGVTTIDLAYSTDGGETYPFVIGTELSNTGSYLWAVPMVDTQTARVRITAHGAAGFTAADDSDADFEINGVTLISPNGGEVWSYGQTQPIDWTAMDTVGVTTIDLAYSTDGGETYPFAIGTGLPNTGSYLWEVPMVDTQTARVRVTAHDTAGLTTADDSDTDFEIDVPLPPAAVAEVLLGPGEVLGVYPSPACAGEANVLYRIPQAAAVDVSIYDVTGHLVRNIATGAFPGGVRMVRWDGRDERGKPASAGIYLVRLVADSGIHQTKRLVLFR
jgi:hypothetical protein